MCPVRVNEVQVFECYLLLKVFKSKNLLARLSNELSELFPKSWNLELRSSTQGQAKTDVGLGCTVIEFLGEQVTFLWKLVAVAASLSQVNKSDYLGCTDVGCTTNRSRHSAFDFKEHFSPLDECDGFDGKKALYEGDAQPHGQQGNSYHVMKR